MKELKQGTAAFGTELFRHAFMAIDYLEMRLTPKPKVMWGKSQVGNCMQDHSKVASCDESRDLKLTIKDSISHVSAEKCNATHLNKPSLRQYVMSDRGDVPGWVLVVLMTTGLVTAIWAVAAPRLNAILKNSLDSMNNIR